MRLPNLNKFSYLLIFFFIFTTTVNTEETIDIWKKDNQETTLKKSDEIQNESNIERIAIKKNKKSEIEISENSSPKNEEVRLLGIYDPEENDLSLNIWSKSDGNDIKEIMKRLDKIQLSNSAEDYFIKLMMTYSYLPEKNMTEDEFTNLKINWLIKNNKDELLENLLNKNPEFKNKGKVIQYLVDKNIAKANLKDGCKKSQFISKEIKDPYLEKFKIYCLIFNDKKNEAQLVFDILKEQKMSDKFFDNKINFLLGINDKNSQEIKDNNLLNFYLSSITVKNFNYQPDEKTNKFIWEYLNAANLIEVDDIEDKERISSLEKAANNDTLDKLKIFEIYKRIPFELNSLINADGIYQSLGGTDARALIYQKYLLSDNTENKIKLLITLKDLFKRDDLSNIYTKFLSDNLKELKNEDIPDVFKNFVSKNILTEEEYILGKIKYDDKILHRSKILRHYTEINTPNQKTQKDINSTYKKIKKNRKYFYSAKDLALLESLEVDGFIIPKEINHKEKAKNYTIPESLLKLVENGEIGLMTLKFIEIIGEDEIYNLDADTIYFMVNILNQTKLINFRNKILNVALPLRS